MCNITESSTSMTAMQQIKIMLICSFKKKEYSQLLLGKNILNTSKPFQTKVSFIGMFSPQ